MISALSIHGFSMPNIQVSHQPSGFGICQRRRPGSPYRSVASCLRHATTSSRHSSPSGSQDATEPEPGAGSNIAARTLGCSVDVRPLPDAVRCSLRAQLSISRPVFQRRHHGRGRNRHAWLSRRCLLGFCRLRKNCQHVLASRREKVGYHLPERRSTGPQGSRLVGACRSVRLLLPMQFSNVPRILSGLLGRHP
jgi:hypothetical protein